MPRRSSSFSARRRLALFALGAASCGPSVQSIYEGNVRFEHCYRLDLDLDVAPSHREACWKRWLSAYTYGQPRDRIEYARRRVRTFAAGDSSRPTLNLGDEYRPQDRQFYLVVPAPTSVRAPPPPIATQIRPVEPNGPPPTHPAGPDAGKDSDEQKAPGDRCADDCRAAWESCLFACEAEKDSADDDAGASGPGQARKSSKPTGNACLSCEPDYKACMKRCFE